MNQASLRTNALLLLLLLFTVGCTIESVQAQKIEPTKTPEPPRCQQDNKSRKIGTRFLFSPDEKHYAQEVPDPADPHFVRVLTDGRFVRERFDVDSMGPIVFHPGGERFAFIATWSARKYILEYASGGETPLVAEPIEEAWQDYVCYGATGKYLFTVAKSGGQWYLYARTELPNSSFTRMPLYGEPSRLELLPARNDGREGFQYQLASDPMQMEIKGWLK